MPKPALESTRWATDETNNTAPSSGQRDTGWTVGQDGVSDYDNSLKKAYYDWFEWLDAETFGDVTIEGSTTFTGTTAITLSASVNDADPQGDGTTDGLRTLEVTPSASNNWSLNGLVGGVEGREILITNVDFSAYRHFYLTHEATAATAANRFALPATITTTADDTIRVYPGGSVRVRYSAAIDRWVVIAVSGCRMKKVLAIPAAAATVADTVNAVYDLAEWNLSNVVALNYPLVIPVGSEIAAYRVYYDKDSDGTVDLSSQLVYFDGTPASPSVSTTTAGAYTYFEETGLSEAVGFGGGPPTLVVTRQDAGGSPDKVYHALVYYWDLI